MNTIFFDESLAVLVDALLATLGREFLLDGTVLKGVALRDASGLLCFISESAACGQELRQEAENAVRVALGRYACADRALLFSDDPGAKYLLEDEDRLLMSAGTEGKFKCWVVDRRIVGSGWMVKPVSIVSKPPRIVFASLKGGVGRSTALAVTAFDLASRGRNVLVVDLDLEAPGLANLLLTKERKPRFGVADYLVENGLGDGIPDASLDEFIGVSSLTTGSSGRVGVLPAFGTCSTEAPQNVLPKLARAMIEDVSTEGETKSLGTQISEMIHRLSVRGAYDIVLIDSRAGLAELAAPAVLGLGALVLLFGTAQEQTIDGYRALFAGLNLLAIRALEQGDSADWRLLLKPVYAKASLEPQIGARHEADLYDLFADNLYDQEDDQSEFGVNFGADDQEAPHAPLVIPFDSRFVDFDPARYQGQMAKAFYEQTFRPFLSGLDQVVSDLIEESKL